MEGGKDMKAINQAKDFSVCIHGYTLPKYALYGNVYGVTWYTADTKLRNGSYTINVWAENKNGHGGWSPRRTADGYGAIYVRIRDFMKSPDFIREKPVFCEHRQKKRLEMNQAVEEIHRQKNRVYEEVAREACPFRRVPLPQYRASAYQLRAAEFYNSAPTAYADKGADMDVMQHPEVFHRDGVILPFNKYSKIQNNDRKNYSGSSRLVHNDDGTYTVKSPSWFTAEPVPGFKI